MLATARGCEMYGSPVAEMAAEQEILEYYRNHPVLQAKQRQDFNDKHVGNMEELLLPLALEEMK